MKYERAERAFAEMKAKEENTIAEIFALYREIYEDFRCEKGTSFEYTSTGSSDETMLLLCWIARLVERIYRIHAEDLSHSETEKRWDAAKNKLEEAAPVLEERRRLIETLEEKITEANTAVDVAMQRQLQLQEELAQKERDKKEQEAGLTKISNALDEASAKLDYVREASAKAQELLKQKQQEFEECVRQEKELQEQTAETGKKLQEAVNEKEEMLRILQRKLDFLLQEETGIAKEPVLARKWLQDSEAFNRIQERFEKEYRDAKSAYDNCFELVKAVMDLAETGRIA